VLQAKTRANVFAQFVSNWCLSWNLFSFF